MFTVYLTQYGCYKSLTLLALCLQYPADRINLVTGFVLRAKSAQLYMTVNKKILRLAGYTRPAFDVSKGECPEKYVAFNANCGALWMKLYELFLNLKCVVPSNFETPLLWCFELLVTIYKKKKIIIRMTRFPINMNFLYRVVILASH